MAYEHTSRSSLRALLAARLGDSSLVQWVSEELDEIIGDTLSKWALLTGQFRARGIFTTSANTALYLVDSQASLAGLHPGDRRNECHHYAADGGAGAGRLLGGHGGFDQ